MRCLICMEDMMPVVDWTNVFLPEKGPSVCETCQQQFKQVQPNCPVCGREDAADLCYDCERWATDGEDLLAQNRSLFHYSEFAKDWVARWKYRGDYALLESIQAQWIAHFKKGDWKNHVLVSVPLSEERLKERGFNQSEALIRSLGKTPVNCFSRVGTEKQSKRQRRERVLAENPFSQTHAVTQSVLLVDDIYTTGTTLRHLATLLKENGCPSVSSLTLFR